MFKIKSLIDVTYIYTKILKCQYFDLIKFHNNKKQKKEKTQIYIAKRSHNKPKQLYSKKKR